MKTIKYTPRDPAMDSAVCQPMPGDVRGDPRKCVIHNYLEPRYPWMKHITVGVRTIRAWDYRCEHNPEGKIGKCARCPGRGLVWATPLPVADVIRRWDAGQDVPEFPAFEIREDEARVIVGQDRQTKRAASNRYRQRVASGEQVVNHWSMKARARAMSDRRKG